MSSWLRNIQGQLSDLANEVLSEANDVLAEAREEVADPDTELIVAKKKCAEAEKQLAIESAKASSLEDEKKGLEQQLYDSHVEMDTIGQKLNGMVRQRDEEIKKLKNQLEQLQESGWGDETPTPSQSVSEDVEARLEEARRQKEREIQALIESHAESMLELREMYEEKIAAMAVLAVSSSTSNADTLDAVLIDREGKSSTNGSDLGDRPVVVDLGSHDELVDERIRQMEAELERCREEKAEGQSKSDAIIESLRSQNEELARAYDELNTEFEQFKERNTATESRNNDLNHRIDSLKASLIEYQERYELCKKESQEAVSQLERLTADFERLRTGVANVTQKREDCDSMVDEEVAKLRNALDESRSERERLRDDMQRFQTAVAEIDVELEKLRTANRALLAENEALTQNLATYDETMKDIISNSERDIGHFREQFHDIQDNHKKQREAVSAENEALREETDAIRQQRDILMEETKLLKEVNERLKQKSASEESKMELMATKIELLEQVLGEEREGRAEKAEKGEKSEEDEQIDVLKAQLREALDANAEKSEECERIRIESRDLEREIDLRQNCVDEMIAQTNTLQMQQETMSATNKNLQTQLLANERIIVQLNDEIRDLKTLVGEDDEKVRRLQETIENSGSSDETQSRYIGDLKEKIEQLEEELKAVKELKLDENIEAEQVRKNLERDLFEAEEVDRGLLEGIENRVKEMESQLIDKIECLETAKTEARTMEERIRELEGEMTKVDVLREQNELLTATVHRLKEEAESAKTNDEEVEEEARKRAASLEEFRQTVAVLQQENEHLKTVAQTHHDENVKYYEQCQALAARINEMQTSYESTDAKKAKELQRLREHLMIVEENSTREAVEAEQRETELRARVRELEARGHAVEEGVTESTQQYQVQIVNLTAKLENVEKAADEWKKKFESETKLRENTQQALASLQNVVRELSVDHERDSAAATHRNLELQAQISALSEEMAQLREELDRQSIGRQAADEETDRRQLQLESKQKIIEDLEMQIEELRSPTRAGTADSYRIDDSTLRQLFLNYFTAEPAKRADIAMLLGSILEYPADEMDKFRSAIRQSFQSSPSSFLFGSRATTPSTSSISEQFIRFLEVESESSRTAPHLPVRSTENAPNMSLDSPRQKSSSPQPPNSASASSSAAALDSLLR